MDKDALVESLIGSGWRLIEALERAGTSVRAAAWIKAAEEDGRWSLYIVSKDVEGKGPIASYRALADTIRQIADPRLSMSDVKLIGEGQRTARDLLEATPLRNGSVPQHAQFTSLGGEPVDDGYVYPMTRPTKMGPSQSVLRFELGSTDSVKDVSSRLFPQGKTVLNRTAWRGKEPRSCGITAIKGRSRVGGSPQPTVYDVEVSYRPKGCITYVGGTRYDGWTVSVLSRADDGTLLDGQGKPLPDGQPPVYRQFETYDDAEFNEMDFGEFVGESEIEGVKHVSSEYVMERIRHSPVVNASVYASFVAPRRHRPPVKIILSNNGSGVGYDGFGTHIINVQKSTPQLRQVILDHVGEVVAGFAEGRYSIKNVSNEDLVFVQMDDLVVDCAPSPGEEKTRFNRLREYLPDTYLDELAMRLMATYEVQVIVVDGPTIGLTLRRVDPTR